MRKIVILITRGDTIGGAQSHVVTLADKLRERGIDVTFVVGGSDGPLTEVLRKKNFSYHLVPFLKREISPICDLLAVVRLAIIIRRLSPDIVSIHSTKAGILGRLVCLILRKPSVFTAHGWAFTEGIPSYRRKIYSRIEKALASVSAKIIAVSDYDRELAIREGLPNKKIVRIHNGIANGSRNNQIRETGDTLEIGMVARFDVPKNQKALIAAMANLDDANLHFWGDGPKLDECKSLVSTLRLSDRVIFHGYSANILDSLGGLDVFVLVSEYEGFPISTIEAMSAGLPVVVSNVGGAGEPVVHGSNGYLLEDNTPECIRKYLMELKASKVLRKSMGEVSKKLFEEKYTADIMVDQTVKVFEEAYFKK